MKKVMIVLSIMIFLMVGCIRGVTDPNASGDPCAPQEKTIALDPNAGDAVQKGLNIVPIVTTVGTAILPQYAALFSLIGAGVGWAAGLWRKLNPVLQKARTKQEIGNLVLKSVVKAVESATDAAQSEIKTNVATNLEASEISLEGKILIAETKAALKTT
ncbi:MAG: hypothetical protein A2173_03805 [Planctomycetes bacterium RBG_13_44_8b]|nr:MAG: hypothetical protein A2173_03805 [Planctomycetes bacterium RBG_13_44_8b]